MSSALTIAPGTVFARDFRIERPLAEGGMGAVYVVVQMSTGRRRALKLMQPALAQDEEARRRFMLEARVGAKIASEHLVEVQAAGVDEETRAPYLVMELLEGEDLASRLHRAGGMDKDEIRELFRQMCHALGAAHALGIVHRDLKPANVFLAAPKRADGPGFHVKILDFGIAKLTQANATLGSRTQPGSALGTPLWMAPEQTGGSAVTPAADVWALGLILYTVITGRSFWRSEDGTLAEIFREVLVEPIPSPVARAREQNVSFPAELEPVLLASVVREPASRHADAATFYRALDAALSGVTFVPAPRASEGLALAATAMADAPLELAFEPSRPRTTGPSPNAETLAAPPPAPPRPAAERPVLAEPTRSFSIPTWAIVAAGFGLAIGGGCIAVKSMRGDFYAASCALCTIQAGTTANGPTPLSEIRHVVEERFPHIRSHCIEKADHAGKVVLRFTVRDGVVRERPGLEPVSDVNLCIAEQLRGLHVGPPGERIVIGARGIAETERPTAVVYKIEYDPKQ